MAIEFDDVKETVRAVALRLDSPSSNYNFVFSESDEAVEVRVEMGNSLEPLFAFIVDAERFRVIKDLEINPEGYASFTYHSYVELLSFILEYFYPVYYKLNNGAAIMDMVSKVLGQKIRIWKDLLRVICKSGDVEYYDLGGSFTVLDVNFSYNLERFTLSLSGGLSETYRCQTVMELVCTLLTILAYMFQREDLDINPILGDQIADEANDAALDEMAETLALGDEIDEAGGGEPMGEDLSSEFEPAGDSAENTAPDLEDTKEQILESVGSSRRIFSSKGVYPDLLVAETNKYILSTAGANTGFSAWVGPDGKVLYLPSGKDHMDVVFQNPNVFGLDADELTKYSGYKNSDDGILDGLYSSLYSKGWVRVRNFNKLFFASCAEPLTAVPNMKKWAGDVLSSGVLKDSTEVSFSGRDFHSSKVFTLGELVQSGYKDLLVAETNSKLIVNSPYSLFGDFEPFSEVVRRVVPKEAGEPVFMKIWREEERGQISFDYYLHNDLIHLTLSGWLSGFCLVTVADGVNVFNRFNSYDELLRGFSSWYSGLWG